MREKDGQIVRIERVCIEGNRRVANALARLTNPASPRDRCPAPLGRALLRPFCGRNAAAQRPPGVPRSGPRTPKNTKIPLRTRTRPYNVGRVLVRRIKCAFQVMVGWGKLCGEVPKPREMGPRAPLQPPPRPPRAAIPQKTPFFRFVGRGKRGNGAPLQRGPGAGSRGGGAACGGTRPLFFETRLPVRVARSLVAESNAWSCTPG